uniref:L-arabinose isomerase central domain-containing protein n=1 Tax=Candidatus Methanosuratincola petrocarbonis (ex Vanwonterghem et al. 2016) TaxID=1867261 RepID=A0A7J3UZM0_9CREN
MAKVKVGLVGVYAGNFDLEAAERGYQDSIRGLQKLAQELDFELVAIPKGLGDVESCIAARKELEAKGVDFLLLQLSAFAAGEIVAVFADMGVRLGLWGVPEPAETGMLRLNSLCGVNLYAAILGTYLSERKVKFKWFFGRPEDELFQNRFRPTVAALKAIKALDGAKFANIGGTPEGYYDVYWNDGRLRSKFNVIVRRHELSEVFAIADKLSDAEVSKVAKEIMEEVPSKDITEREFKKLARVYMAFERIIKDNEYTGVAIACWPQFQAAYGLAACTTLGRLNEKGYIAACEGDIPSAVSMAIMKYMGEGKPVLMDLSKFDTQDDSILFWHCGVGHPSWGEKCIQCPHSILKLPDETGKIKGAPAAYEMVFKPGLVTLMRLTDGGNRLLLVTGEVLKVQKPSVLGTRGWVGNLKLNGEEKISALEFTNTVLVNGFEHHFPLARGDLSEAILEFAAWLDIQPLAKVPYRNYLQVRAW